MITGATKESARKDVVLGTVEGHDKDTPVGRTAIGGLIVPPYKVIIEHALGCGVTPSDGCLYDIYADESEENNLASSNSTLFYDMMKKVAEYTKDVYSPDRGDENQGMAMFCE